MKTEWWYNDAVYHYSDHQTLALARLLVREDGTAQVLTDGGEVIELESEEEALLWLVAEEYRRLGSLLEDFRQEGIPLDARIKVPDANSHDELLRQMVIELEPTRSSASPAHPDMPF